MNHPYEAVFISDLHLHPEEPKISQRFEQCMHWAAENTDKLYILGDFFHVWPGDDGFTPWSLNIAKQLKSLGEQGTQVYFMPGNRDFLLGKGFVRASGVTWLTEPTVIELQGCSVLLVHGDRYCTKDKAHQWLRRLTRNALFINLFLALPFKLRNALVNGVRQRSQQGTYRPDTMGVVPEVLLAHLQKFGQTTIIHGHTHQPGLTEYTAGGQTFQHYVLSDWDDSPQLLCYDQTKGFQFVLKF